MSRLVMLVEDTKTSSRGRFFLFFFGWPHVTPGSCCSFSCGKRGAASHLTSKLKLRREVVFVRNSSRPAVLFMPLESRGGCHEALMMQAHGCLHRHRAAVSMRSPGNRRNPTTRSWCGRSLAWPARPRRALRVLLRQPSSSAVLCVDVSETCKEWVTLLKRAAERKLVDSYRKAQCRRNLGKDPPSARRSVCAECG